MQRVFVALATCAALAGGVAAAAPVAVLASSPVTVYVNGYAMSFDQPPEVRNGRVFVPLRAIFQQLGATVVYNQGEIDATDGNRTVALHIGSTQATVNGQQQYMDVAPYVTGARTLVPLRFVATALGANVNWNSSNNSVTIEGGRGSNATPRQTFFTSNSPTGNIGPQRQPQLLFSLSRPSQPGMFNVWLDGTRVTQYVRAQSARSYAVSPPYPLQPMRHTVRVMGRTVGGAKFDLHWSFTTTP